MTKRGSLTGNVYKILRRAILEQRLGPGMKLPEDTIGEQLSVSRTVVRRALDMLCAEELVDVSPNKSASVARPTIDEAKDAFNVRIDLERLVIERICGKITPGQEKLLLSSIAKEEQAHKNRQADYVRRAAEFHILLAEMAGSPLLLKYLSTLIAKSPIILGLYGRPNWQVCNLQEHRNVVSALVNDEKERALTVMENHLHGLLTMALDTEPHDAATLQSVLQHYAGIEKSKRKGKGKIQAESEDSFQPYKQRSA